MEKCAGDATLTHGNSTGLTRGAEGKAGDISRSKDGTPPTTSSWASIFRENGKLENGLKLKGWGEEEREIVENDLCNVEETWGIYIVGFILGHFPGRKAVDDLRNNWGVKHHFYIHPSRLMVFKFESQEEKERVLIRGPYNTYGTPWLLKSLPPFFKFGEECLNFIPTWIQQPSLPLECWNEMVLGKIVSHVGKPISSDQCTALRSRSGYARILVEVDMNMELVKEVVFKLPNGDVIHQQVVFEHPPVLCAACKRIGHSEMKCRKNEKSGMRPPASKQPLDKSGKQGRSRSRSRRPGKETQVGKWVPQGKTLAVVQPVQLEKGEKSKLQGATSAKGQLHAKDNSGREGMASTDGRRADTEKSGTKGENREKSVTNMKDTEVEEVLPQGKTC